jgi:hypothetical protein
MGLALLENIKVSLKNSRLGRASPVQPEHH